MTARPELVLFDVDGTLITTGGAGARAWDRAFRRLFDVGVDIEEVTEAGWADPQVLRVAFRSALDRDPEPAELARVVATYLEYLPEEVEASSGYRVLDGVTDLLPKLCADGLLLGITSGNLEAAARIKLDRGRLNRFFSVGGYGSDSEDRSELTVRAIERAEVVANRRIDRDRIVVVGDTPRDVEAARAAGAVSAAVASGSYAAAELEAAGADRVLDSLAEPLPGL